MGMKVEVEVVVWPMISRREMWSVVDLSGVGQWMTTPGVDVRQRGHAVRDDDDEMSASCVVGDCPPERWAAYLDGRIWFWMNEMCAVSETSVCGEVLEGNVKDFVALWDGEDVRPRWRPVGQLERWSVGKGLVEWL